ncbi:unnamed protein product [Phyllotreta striolata]|uniref:Uncharacterized protein n=1 Tax=Phyllotreta striolata TaxID=444603 RepID=A0A9N9TYY1_PHYSR|nr:unnamed protein product [Phyllotreta striolata]
MTGRKSAPLVLACLYWTMVNECLCDVATLAQNENSAVSKFRDALQQQNTITILASIEERLRNLDTMHSLQLSRTFETKLDQYNRKLENLDSKLMRLEALVMMNLGKISENISTKNFKDDIAKTDTSRKLDSIYESITNRLNYVERKLDVDNAKIQEKFEKTFLHLDRIEKGTSKRDSDLETELSTVIKTLENLKKTNRITEEKFLNVSAENKNVSKHTLSLLVKYNSDARKFANKLHDNIVNSLQYIDNRTAKHMQISDETNVVLKQMKIDLKDDFNSYANKVADMNSDMWKNTDTTEDDLKSISFMVNNTQIELQNGVRSLMIQIGKISQKSDDAEAETNHKELEDIMTANFDKVLTNQEVFLESCHRLQMDESQIESEISVMLNKLIDMLEKKLVNVTNKSKRTDSLFSVRLANEVKDIKNFEKNLKNHDNRINRNLFQANQNIISLSEKSTMITQMITSEIRKIGTDLNALFSFVQSTTNEGSSAVSSKVILDKLNNIDKHSRNLEKAFHKPDNVSNHQLHIEIQKLSKSLTTILDRIQNYTRDINTNIQHLLLFDNTTTTTDTKHRPEINETIREAINQVFSSNFTTTKKKCPPNYRGLIDIRADLHDCEEATAKKPKPTRKSRRRKLKYDIDVRSDINSRMGGDDDDDTTTTTEMYITTTMPNEELNNMETTTMEVSN